MTKQLVTLPVVGQLAIAVNRSAAPFREQQDASILRRSVSNNSVSEGEDLVLNTPKSHSHEDLSALAPTGEDAVSSISRYSSPNERKPFRFGIHFVPIPRRRLRGVDHRVDAIQSP
ncbi:MAG: hypothetical protein AAGC97_06880, partial [Planctomycetota bacterium]